MKRLREIRTAFGYSNGRLATELGLDALRIKGWESGERAPTPSELRDLAMVYGTSVDDLVGEESLKERPVRTWHLVDGDGIDGFWGHFGVMLPGTSIYRWHPLTGCSADSINAEISGARALEDEPLSMVAKTLNGRLLWVSLEAVKCVSLCDEGEEWPEPCADVEVAPGRREPDLEAHPSQVLPLVAYETLTEYVRNDEWPDDVSGRLKQFLETFLNDRSADLSDEHLRRHLLSVKAWMSDGSNLWFPASPASMAGAVADLEVGGAGGLVSLADDEEGFVSQSIALRQVAMLEFPAALLRGQDQPD
ncbi:helix-turn-helix transcriptional regulator [Pelagibius sp. CAU 1746]|uniref:helix-turn-helix domain-containing protein n=1 Tax=Pelagibius sp. CAU 1746 TaxID=3140370 RepID=UPI00325B4C2B